MEALIIIALILAGLLLFIVEVFLIPGISIAGIASVICILYANYCAFSALGPEAGFLTLAVSAVGCIGITAWFMHSKTMDKLSLKKSLDYKINPLKGLNIKVGNKGIKVTNPRHRFSKRSLLGTGRQWLMMTTNGINRAVL